MVLKLNKGAVGIKRLTAIILCCLLFCGLGVTCYAEATLIDGDALSNKLHGKGNYSLDMESVGILETGYATLNSLASTLYNDVIANIVAATCTVYHYCTTLPIVQIIQPELAGVQNELKTGFFDGLFPLLFLAVGFSGAALFLKRNFIRIASEMGYTMLVMVFAVLLGNSTPTLIEACDSITLAVSNTISTSFNDGRDVIDSIWNSMVVVPWQSLNLQNHHNDNGFETIIQIPANTEERQDYIDSLIEGGHRADKEVAKTVFSKARASSKLGCVLIYFLPALFKCGLYLIFGGLQLALRLAIIFLVLCGIFVLALSLVPQLGGKGILFKWLRNIFTCMILSALVTFLFSFMMKIDSVLYNLMGNDGWLIVILLQVLLMIMVIVFREQIVKMFVGLAQGRAGVEAAPVRIYGGDATDRPYYASPAEQVRTTLSSAGDDIMDAYAERIVRRQGASAGNAGKTARTPTVSASPADIPQESSEPTSTAAEPLPDNVIRLSDYRQRAAAAPAEVAPDDSYDPSYKEQPIYLRPNNRHAAAASNPTPSEQIRRVTNHELL